MKRSKFVICVMVIVLGILIVRLTNTKDEPKFTYSEIIKEVVEKIEVEQELQAEADLQKNLLETRVEKANRMIEEVNNDIELITLEESGSYGVKHKRVSDDSKFKKFVSGSEIELNTKYKAICSINTADIKIFNSDGMVIVNYSIDDIRVKSVEFTRATSKSSKSLFGKKYSNSEVLALLDITKGKIYEQINNDNSMKSKSSDNLNNFLIDIAKQLDLPLVINSIPVVEPQYSFINNGIIKYNHGYKPLKKVDYIVVHSTAVYGVDALKFYNVLNDAKTDKGTSAHFFVDDKNVVQCIGTNMQAYHVGIGNTKLNCNNDNSIGVEICVIDNQQQAIENAAKFVKEVLMIEFPDAKVVLHREVKATECASILTDNEFEEYFK